MAGIVIVEYFVLFWIAKYCGLVDRRFVPNLAIYRWLGLLMTIAGVAFAVWARVAIGSNWSGTVTVKQNHELIRTGPYALVRHPIYTGIMFAAFGTAIFHGEVQSLIVLLAIFSVLVPKMRAEERLMTEQFGTEYTNYRQKTKALVPFLW